jgi:hypothetical protein
MRKWLIFGFFAILAYYTFAQDTYIFGPVDRQVAVSDAQVDVGVTEGLGFGATNHTKINTAIQDRSSAVKYPIMFRGGGYDFQGTIGAGVTRSDWSLIGSGVGNKTGGNADSFWTSSGQDGGSQATRFYWNKALTTGVFPLDRVLFRTDATNVLIRGIDLYGTRRMSYGGSAMPRLTVPGTVSAWVSKNVDSGVITIDVDSTGTDIGTYTRTDAGSFTTDGFIVGDVVIFSGFVTVNNGPKTVTAVSGDGKTLTVINHNTASSNLTDQSGDGNEQARWAYAPNSFVTHTGEVWRAASSGVVGTTAPPGSGWVQAGYWAHIGIWHQSSDYHDAWNSGTDYDQWAVVSHINQVWVASAGNPNVGDVPGTDPDWVASGYKLINRQNGPLIIPNMVIADCDIGILAGPHSDSLIVNGTGARDENTQWGDTLQVGSLQLRTPIGVWIRTLQSVANTFDQLTGRTASSTTFSSASTGGNSILWCEFGGESDVQNMQVYNYRTMLRVGHQPHFYPIQVHSFKVDGLVTHFRMFWADHNIASSAGTAMYLIENGSLFLNNLSNTVDAAGVPASVQTSWDSGSTYSLGAIVGWRGAVWEANQATSAGEEPGVSAKWDVSDSFAIEPLIIAGPGILTVRNVHGLWPNSIRMVGIDTSNNDTPCVVILDNVTFARTVNHPSDVIDRLSVTAAHKTSVAPYVLIWKNCSRSNYPIVSTTPFREQFRDGHYANPTSLVISAASTPP